MLRRAMSAETHAHASPFADRTSSFQALHPSFRNFSLKEGEGAVRYVERGRAWIGATEPFTHPVNRISAVRQFFESAKEQHKRATLLPVSENLSQACVLAIPDCERIQVGSEPIFDLREKFAEGQDPLLEVHRARALKRRGAQIEHHFGSSSISESLRETLNSLAESWHEGLRTHSLGFLNRVDLWDRAEAKHFFVLRYEGRLGGFLTAVPLSGRAGAFYFAEVIRASGSKAGTIELLMLEAMRILKENYQGTEVRLGLCPLSLITADPLAEKTFRLRITQSFLQWLGQQNTSVYGFRSAFEFKAKLGPSRWEPLYLLSSNPIGLPTARDVQAAHFDTETHQGFFSPWMEGFYRKHIREPLKNFVKPRYQNDVPTHFQDALSRLRMTGLSLPLLLSLHIWKSTTSIGAETYANTGYWVENPKVLGWLVGPLFHNHHYHFFGDFVSFAFFGALLEILISKRLFLGITAFGLWLTNPLAHGIVALASSSIPADEYQRFLTEVDYGSSNAIYAFVGALAVRIKNPMILMAPFAVNGLYLCFAKQSWLSLHHLIALGGGWLIARLSARS
jgi:hypothetical protein